MNVFAVVKENVTARQVAMQYGIKINRSGLACCPFHKDKTPSMKIDKRYYCFGCGDTGGGDMGGGDVSGGDDYIEG